MGLKVDTPHGRCCAMDSREVLMIGTIKELPYKLVAFSKKDLIMSVLVVDIPPYYGMSLSRKWSASMGGSLQCDLSYATFCIDGKNVKVKRESRVPYMMVHIVQSDEDMNCFVDTRINTFRVEDSP